MKLFQSLSVIEFWHETKRSQYYAVQKLRFINIQLKYHNRFKSTDWGINYSSSANFRDEVWIWLGVGGQLWMVFIATFSHHAKFIFFAIFMPFENPTKTSRTSIFISLRAGRWTSLSEIHCCCRTPSIFLFSRLIPMIKTVTFKKLFLNHSLSSTPMSESWSICWINCIHQLPLGISFMMLWKYFIENISRIRCPYGTSQFWERKTHHDILFSHDNSI